MLVLLLVLPVILLGLFRGGLLLQPCLIVRLCGHPLHAVELSRLSPATLRWQPMFTGTERPRTTVLSLLWRFYSNKLSGAWRVFGARSGALELPGASSKKGWNVYVLFTRTYAAIIATYLHAPLPGRYCIAGGFGHMLHCCICAICWDCLLSLVARPVLAC